MVTVDLRPLRLVKGEGFLKLMSYLEPNYKAQFIYNVRFEKSTRLLV